MPDGSLVGSSFFGNDFRTDLAVVGTYTLVLSGTDPTNPTNPYQFTVTSPPVNTAALTLNTPVSGTIAQQGQENEYTFTAKAGDRIYFNGLDTYPSDWSLQLTSPAGSTVDNGFETTEQSFGPLILPETGQYTLTILSPEYQVGELGSYNFEVFDANVGSTDSHALPTVTLGNLVSGSLATGQSAALYQFDNATAGARVVFDHLSTPFDGTITIDGPDGTTFVTSESVSSFGGSPDFTVVLPTAGDYTIVLLASDQFNTPPFSYTFQIDSTTTNQLSLALNTPTSGTITTPGQQDVYSFTGSVGERVYYDSLLQYSYPGSGLQAVLTSPSGQTTTLSFDADDDSSAPVTLAEAGKYTLTIAAPAANAGALSKYDFQLLDATVGVPSDTTAPASITLGTPVTDTITNGQQAVLYQYDNTTANTRLYLSLSSHFYGSLTLDGPDGTQQITSTSFYNGESFSLQATLSQVGDYTLVVSANDPYDTITTSNPATLTFTVTAPPTNTTANISFAHEYKGTLSTAGQIDDYTFAGTLGQRVYFDSLLTAYGNVNAQLFGPDGQQLSFQNAFYDAGLFVLPESGTYTLQFSQVQNPSSSSNQYDFELLDATNPPAITLGTPTSGTLATGEHAAIYSLTSSSANERIVFTGLSFTSTSGDFFVYSPNGSEVTEFYFGNGDTVVTLPTAGRYTIVLDGALPGSTPNAYSFTASQAVTNNLGTLTLGTPVSGSISTPGQQNVYTFNGTVGQRLYFDPLSSPSPYLRVQIFSPDGTDVFDFNTIDDYGLINALPESGLYTVVVSGYDAGDSSTYDFELLDAAAAKVVTPTLAGTTVSGTLNSGLQSQLFQFAGTKGERVLFNNQSFASNSGIVYLFAPQGGTSLTDFGFGTDALITLPSTGTYVFAVAGNDSTDATDTFSFKVSTPATNTAALTIGTPVTGSIAPGQLDQYTFTGAAGQTLYFDQLNSTNTLNVQLQSPDGTTIFNNGDGGDAGPIVLPESGVYTLVFQGNSADATGTYDENVVNLFTQPRLNLGTGEVDLTVSLGQASNVPVEVNFATADGTAKAGTDYLPASGIVVFEPGQTSRTVAVQYIDENNAAGKTIDVKLSNAVNGTISATAGTGVITLDSQTATNLSINSVSTVVGATATTAVFTVTLSQAASTTTTVNFATADGTAKAGTNYTSETGTLTFAPGVTSEMISVPILANTNVGPNLTYTVTLSNASANAGITTAQGTGTIVNDNDTISIGNASATVGASATTATFTVTLAASVTSSVTVNYATADDTAKAGTDYTAESGTLTFAPGVTSQQIVVPILANTNPGLNTDFFVNLTNPSTHDTITTGQGVGTILNKNETSASIAGTSDTVGASQTTASFTVTLAHVTSLPVSIQYATSDGTAKAGTDYTAESNTLTIPAGSLTGTINVPVLANTNPGPNLTFTVTLSNPTNVTLSNTTATGTIVNKNQTNVSIGNASATVGATATTATFTVSLGAASGQTVTVAYATSDVTAVAGTDYTAKSGTLTFAPGVISQQIVVAILADTNPGLNKTFDVTLSNPSNATIVTGTGVGTILNKNETSASIADTSDTVGASQTTAAFTVTLAHVTSLPVSIQYATSDGTAKAGTDYTAESNTLTIPAGSLTGTIDIPVLANTNPGSNLTFTVTLSNPTNVTLSNTTATGTIVNKNETNVSIGNASATVGAAATTATFTVSLGAASGQTVTVAYATSDVTAKAGTDYTAKSGTLTFARRHLPTDRRGDFGRYQSGLEQDFRRHPEQPLQRRDRHRYRRGHDPQQERDHRFRRRHDGQRRHSPTTAAFTVTLAAATSLPVSIQFATADGTAKAGVDYTSDTGTITFAAGTTSQTINVPVLADTNPGANKTFTLVLSNPTNVTLSRAVATATLSNANQAGTFDFSAAAYSVQADAGTETITVDRINGSSGDRHGRLRHLRRDRQGRDRLQGQQRHLDVRSGRHQSDLHRVAFGQHSCNRTGHR